jgi:DNA-binding XRE family transcriptional regulator
MAKPFSELRARMTPAARRRSARKAKLMLEEMALTELREARALTQEQLARILRINQAAISKMERRADMYLSTLQGIIKAMGGKLEIRAIFPDGIVRISQFRKSKKSA